MAQLASNAAGLGSNATGLLGYSQKSEVVPVKRPDALQPIRSLHTCFEMPPGATPVAGFEKLMVFFCDNRWR